ncbi:hypothetical protein ACFLXB_07415 [Chloroflexota bacterium]
MEFNKLIEKKVILAGVLLAIILVFISLVYLLWIGPNLPKQTPSSLNVVITIIPAATSTPRFSSPTPPPMSPTPPPTLTPIPGTIAINTYVQISGTDGDGLRIRTSPSLSSDPLFLGFDSEVFLVVDGPKEADGFVWWSLTAPYDQNRTGWAVANYLISIPSP